MDAQVSSIVQTASAASNSATQEQIGVLVLKKALNAEATTALGLLQALPPVASALATEGTLGTLVNTYA